MRVCLILIVVMTFGLTEAQTLDIMMRYMRPSVTVINNPYDHLTPDFQWSMSGRLQAEINAAINALDEGNPPLALIHLDKAVEIDSNFWVSRYYRGVCYKKLNNFPTAVREFNRTIALNPKLAEPHVELGEIYIIMWLHEKVKNEFEQASRKNQSMPNGYYGLGHAAIFEDKIDKARRLYEKSTEVDSGFAEGYLMRAMIAMQADQNDVDALNLFTRSIRANPTHAQSYFWRSYYYTRKSDYKNAFSDINKALELNPTNPFLTRARGFLYIELNDYEKAFIDFKNALNMQNRELDENKFTGYQTDLDKRIDLQGLLNYLIANGYGLKDETLVALQKGFCLLAAGRATHALASVEEAELNEPAAAVFYTKALILEEKKLHEQALAYYEKALALDRDIYEAHRKKCVYHFEKKDYKSAYEDVNEMFRIQPGSPVAHRFRGLIRSAQGYLGPAIADLTAFIKTDTTDQIAIETRYTCLAVLNKWQEAKPDAEWLLKRTGNNWRKNDEFVSQYLEVGDTAFAVKICDTFSARYPQFYFSELRALEIYGTQRNWAEADQKIAKIMSMITEQKSPVVYSRLYYWKGFISRYRDHNINEALIWFSKAVQFNSTDAEALYALADVFTELGDRKKALKAYELLAKNGYKDAQSRYDSLRNQKK